MSSLLKIYSEEFIPFCGIFEDLVEGFRGTTTQIQILDT